MQEQTIYVVDDDPAARDSVAALARAKGFPARCYESAEAFLAEADPGMRGCLVTDVRMTGMTGLELIEQLNRAEIPLPVIAITGYGNVPMAVRAMQAGAVSFLEKPCQEDELWNNVELALKRDETDRQWRQRRSDIEERLHTLSEGEKAVLMKLVGEGLPNKRIARDLDIGLRTVELRRATVFKKMGADSLAELVRMALAVDLIPPLTSN